jgi:hypothetical protein
VYLNSFVVSTKYSWLTIWLIAVNLPFPIL